MKAIALTGGLELQKVDLINAEMPGRRYPGDVLVRVLSVGLDGTDREIITSGYGVMPEGEDKLIIGHEMLGVVMEADKGTGFRAGDLVTALVRRPCRDYSCASCRNGQQDFCESGQYTERGIRAAHGYLSEYIVEDSRYLVKVPADCAAYGVLIEPQSIVEKVWNQVLRIQQRLIWQPQAALIAGSGPLGLLTALACRSLGLDTHVWSKSPSDSVNAELVRQCGAVYAEARDEGETLTEYATAAGQTFDMLWECSGHTPYIFEGMRLLASNGVLAMLGVSAGDRHIRIPADLINQEIVLRNKCVIGSVNASRKDFETGIHRLEEIERQFPGILQGLMTERMLIDEVPGIDFATIRIKAVVDLAPPSEWPGLIHAECRPRYSFSV
ncbi:glucose 1-dehydrogenase [Paenibacillus sp. J5C_2022]|uniref:glucose 1-dehydrogenase n=1 Tax=Paenibacillus sp. J5C2022 TaxID=2977129 RepID=UPI0021D1AD39|nr:glucose 1-dehydrogenase [Paenibacillus sp. J5C2022]MCU6710654.1 glucose 1-dehydrogenase [Paenibacillus sp. J5C2022]